MSFQEPSDLVTLVVGNGRQELVGCVVITPQDRGLILDKGQGQREAENPHILIGYVYPVVGRDISKEVHGSTVM